MGTIPTKEEVQRVLAALRADEARGPIHDFAISALANGRARLVDYDPVDVTKVGSAKITLSGRPPHLEFIE